MNATSTIARRYLFSKKHISLVSTLTVISIFGVTLGTALLIIVLSVFNGFFEVIQQLLLANDPDIRIESAEGRYLFVDEETMNGLATIPNVVSISPFLEGKVVLAHQRARDKVAVVKGIYPERFASVSEVANSVIEGRMDLSVRDRFPGVMLSDRISNSQRLFPGDQMALLSAAGMQRALTQFTGPRNYAFEVRAVYRQNRILDEDVVYVDMQAARRLLSERAGYSGIDIRLNQNRYAETVKKQAEAKLGPHVRVLTWYDLQKPLYDVMNLEKWGAYLILMIIVLVAVLNIVGSLTMVVIQKKKDIGILLSLGIKKKEIRKIFIKQGWYIGIIGCVLGGGIGLLTSFLQREYGLVKLAGAESFIIQAYPVAIIASDVILVLAGSLLLCLLASWYPAVLASSIQPSEAIRYE